MSSSAERAVAIVGVGAVLPDAPNAPAFWQNIRNKKYSIVETPPERWSIADYYDPDPSAPDKTYSKIGAWVRGFQFDWKRFRVPPKVADAMDEGQQWAVTIAAEALADYGYPLRPLNTDRVGVILGTAMGGEMHYTTAQRIAWPEYARWLNEAPEFAALPAATRSGILAQWHSGMDKALPAITEDTMPGELPNIVAGRVANVLNLRGPSFITDAACASSFAAVQAGCEALFAGQADAVIAGGVDRNMGATVFVKFCKIGALSATGSRPFGEGADGFVMGEGSGAFLLKRLSDAARDGDRIYAVIRGVGASSDGKGKGITAPNPQGQLLAIQRAWESAGLEPSSATLVEAHGTSTRVGDVVEVESLTAIFGMGARPNSIALGSAKGNIGHLKAGAGAAGLLKAALALHEKVLPPTLNAERPNPNIDFSQTPFYLNHELRNWDDPQGAPRRAGVSAYGFGGANFHLVMEEYVPGMLKSEPKSYASAEINAGNGASSTSSTSGTGETNGSAASAQHGTAASRPLPPRGILAVGVATPAALKHELDKLFSRVESGWTPARALPAPDVIRAAERLVIDFADPRELLDKLGKARKAVGFDNPQAWKALQGQGIFRGSGPRPGKIAYLFPGQGSQYANMGRELASISPTVAAVFAEADRVMTPILGRTLTSYIFVDSTDPSAVKQAEMDLMQTAITQPAMLTLDTAILLLLRDFGFTPDMAMGHSLGEYAALIAAGIMPFAHALEASAARGAEMSKVSLGDNGWMAAVMAPYPVIEEVLKQVDGYVVAANINSNNQSVVGGEGKAVEQAMAIFTQQGFTAVRIPVSHAFHTKLVAPASKPLRKVLDRLTINTPQLPLVANVTGDLYPTTVEGIKDILELQIASPVQWVKGLETLYANGVRTFVEVGPKKALKGFVDDVLVDKPDVWSLFTNHPKTGELASFNHALCGLFAAGYGLPEDSAPAVKLASIDHGNGTVSPTGAHVSSKESAAMPAPTTATATPAPVPAGASTEALGQALAQVLAQFAAPQTSRPVAHDRNDTPAGSVIITGTGLGLPGANKSVMDPDNALRILRGEQFVDLIPERFRKEMATRHITRLVKGADGSGSFETINDTDDVIKLAGRGGAFDLSAEYGVPAKLVEALDITTQLAMAAGLDALREANIPLVQTYRATTKGVYLPDRWMLPEGLRDETGVIFASAFPGGDRMADEFRRFYAWTNLRDQIDALEDLRRYSSDAATLNEIGRRLAGLRDELERNPYEFDRRFIFRILAMGHSQFAEYIGARGPNTHVNAACASTAQAVSIGEDWIRSGRCRRVIVISADNVTSDNLLGWIGSGFLSTGAAAIDDRIEEAALPFDRRRHGTLLGMGACALVVESEDAASERGLRGIVEVLSTETANSAYHGTRLDVSHICDVMNRLVTSAERRFGLNRYALAQQLVFISHETYTPARGGSASAEITALRNTFGDATPGIVVCNTKGFTGHPMGAGIEDVIAVKILEYGIVPPVPNYKEVDPDLGALNLSRGGRYPVQYALHLAAGFGSQISMTLVRRIPGALDRLDNKPLYQRWLADGAGYDMAETEVVKRVLRVVAQGAPKRVPAPSRWQYGAGPMQRTPASGNGVTTTSAPRPLVMPQAAAPMPQPAPLPDTPKPAPITPAPTPIPATIPIPAPIPAAPANQPINQSTNQPVALDAVAENVLALVAAKTGYPQDMLDPDLDLEADLGIDTVKQAETFAAVREAFEIPQLEGIKLRDYPTLQSVIDFVYASKPKLREQREGQAVGSGQSAKDTAAPARNQPINQSTNQPVTLDAVAEKVLALVAEKTGYPQDMLDPDLDLEADLGVDTVKQAETFAAVREAFEIPSLDGIKLRDYPTLQSIIDFVYTNRPDLKGTGNGERGAVPPHTVPNQPSNLSTSHQVAGTIGTLEDADKMPRRVPVPSLRPALDLCLPTGVTLAEGSRVVVMTDHGGVARALAGQLRKQGVTVLALEPGVATDTMIGQLQGWLSEGAIQGVFWLAALDAEPALEEMDITTWREMNRVRVKNLFSAMRTLYESVAGSGRFLVSATRLGGLHGYGSAGASAPMGGGVTGFTKAYDVEQGLRDAGRGLLVKAVDFDMGRTTAEFADLLLAETLSDPGVVEVGYCDGLRYTITLEEQPARDGNPGMVLDKETVFVVTGAAGGITSAIVSDLAVNSGGIFYLLDLVAAPARDDAHIALFRSDKDALKRTLIDEAKTRGEKPTPAVIDKQIAGIERSEAALRAIESVEAAGGTAHYFSLDLRDSEAVTRVVDDIRSRYGKIDVLLHAGGMLIDRTLPNKEPSQFDLVFDIKADGFFSLLKAARGMPVGATVSFSSVAGRFGNNGQSDYSSANDLLCKISSSMKQWRPETRGIAIDWTAWGQIGMASRGSVPAIMEALGVDMLPPESGVPTIRRELTYGGTRGEVVVAGRLGLWTAEKAPNGGLDVDKINAMLAARQSPLVMAGKVTAARLFGGLEVETTLDPAQQPFLFDHMVEEGVPWLPGIMGTEALAEVASLLVPGASVGAVQNLDILSAFKFHRNKPQTLYLSATARPAADGTLVADVWLRSQFQPPKADVPPTVKDHFHAQVILQRSALEQPQIKFKAPKEKALTIDKARIYKVFFHGPAYQVIERASVEGDLVTALMAHDLGPNTSPTDAASLMAPRLVELCFQAAALWSIEKKHAMALPSGFAAATAYRQPEEASGKRLYALVKAVDDGATYDAQVVDEAGNLFVDLKGYRTVQMAGEIRA